MRSKFLPCLAALAVAAPVVLAASAPASAQRWHGHRGFGVGAGIAGLAAGALIGGVAAATTPYWGPGYSSYGDYGYYPGYAYGPGYAPSYAYAPDYDQGYVYRASPGYGPPVRDDAYCAQRFRSYDPASGTYLGYDGIRHACP
jgi:BA14K-like protein